MSVPYEAARLPGVMERISPVCLAKTTGINRSAADPFRIGFPAFSRIRRITWTVRIKSAAPIRRSPPERG